ncbi:MAG: sulfotransferase [Gammaproteobacteria bacterium]|nr:sulfotransferase [Gammaproteobacteria bacterium]
MPQLPPSAPDAAEVKALFELHQRGRHRQLLPRLEPLAAQHPDDSRLLSLLGAAHFELKNFRQAVDAYQAALALQPEHGKLRNALGVCFLRQRRFREAAEQFRQAVTFEPELAPAHYNLGILQEHAEAWDQAAASYRRAIELEPEHVSARAALAGVLRQQGDIQGAVDILQGGLARVPGHLPSLRQLLEILEQTNRHDELRAAVAHAAEQPGHNALVTLYQGIVAEIDGDLDTARRCLETIRIDTAGETSAHHEHKRLARLTGLCDAQGDEADAMGYAAAANRLARQLSEGHGIRAQTFVRFVDNRQALLATDAAAFAPLQPVPQKNAPVFVVGFPRSGTTLLDSMLRGHPALDVLEESPGVASLVTELEGPADEHLHALGRASSEHLAAARRAYYQAIGRAPDDGAVLVDRFALNMVYAGEIAKVFPAARFVLVLRHPLDCRAEPPPGGLVPVPLQPSRRALGTTPRRCGGTVRPGISAMGRLPGATRARGRVHRPARTKIWSQMRPR